MGTGGAKGSGGLTPSGIHCTLRLIERQRRRDIQKERGKRLREREREREREIERVCLCERVGRGGGIQTSAFIKYRVD